MNYANLPLSFAPTLDSLISPAHSPDTAHLLSSDRSVADHSSRFSISRIMTSRSFHKPQDSSTTEAEIGGIPLIDFSRTPSPTPYRARGSSRSGAPSEDEDEGIPISLRPLVAPQQGNAWVRLWTNGGLGQFLFGTWVGWQVYVGLLVVYMCAVEYMLVLLNRFILWTGVYKFPYPITVTLIQLVFAHGWLILVASLTRALAGPLRKLGFSAVIAPSYPVNGRSSGYITRPSLYPKYIISYLTSPTGGIAGGGYLEFNRSIGFKVLPVAVVYAAKVMLSNMSYAWTTIAPYTLSRIAIVPLTLFITGMFTPATHSVSTLSSSLTAVLDLLMASIRSSQRVPLESIVSGVLSSIFVAAYPVLLVRMHHKLTSAHIPNGTSLTDLSSEPFDGNSSNSTSCTKESTRAYWQLLHYISTISIVLVAPFTLISGEMFSIMRNCYVLDVPWFWFLMLCSSLASFAVFSITLALVRATSPLTANFVKVPRQALQLATLSGRLPMHARLGVALCWVGCIWFAATRRQEGRRKEVARLGGR